MALTIEIQKKSKIKEQKERKVSRTDEVYQLQEVQEIKDSIQEILLFIGLDRANHVRNISILGVGNTSGVLVDSKSIIRTAIMSASEKVILVHNHPSNSSTPSQEDKHITYVTSKLLKAFDMELTDHIIVTEDNYTSIREFNKDKKPYLESDYEFIDKALLLEENKMLKKEIAELKENLKENKVVEYKDDVEEDEEEEM